MLKKEWKRVHHLMDDKRSPSVYRAIKANLYHVTLRVRPLATDESVSTARLTQCNKTEA